MAVVLAAGTAVFAPTATADSSLSALIAQRSALQAQMGSLGDQQQAALEHLLGVQNRLADLRRQVARNESELAGLEARKDDLTARISAARERMAAERQSLGALARQQYKSSGQFSADQVFFGSSDFNQVVNRIVASRAMSDRAHSLLADLRGVETALTRETADLNRREDEIRRLQDELASRNTTLQATAADYHAQLDSLDSQSAGLLAQVRALDAEIAAATSPPRGGYTWSQQQVIAIIRAAAQRYNQNGDQLVRVADCESSLNPRAYDASSGASGLFQFMPGTFYGNGGHDIWDPTDQSNIAAKMFSEGHADDWSCR